ncbi:MAG: ribonuclease III [Methanomassiliicoccales archaeon PtaU1.Bin124]|nr:MAG: ribonuclease III [Methanomassiliicoccales archaeon PtaU1.Bin124]
MWWRRSQIEHSGISKDSIKELEGIIGHKFGDKALLIEALSHPSRNAEGQFPTYERLAWVGDAFLYHTISIHLYEVEPNASTSRLHELRENYKKNLDLAKMDAEGLRISRFLITGKSREGQENSSGMIATMVEAVIGAISIENPKRAKKFIIDNIIKNK